MQVFQVKKVAGHNNGKIYAMKVLRKVRSKMLLFFMALMEKKLLHSAVYCILRLCCDI